MTVIKLSSDLLEAIVCPKDHEELVYDEKSSILTCTKCERKYPVREGIPVFV